MCFRLLLAVEPPLPPGELRALATSHGLDLRLDEAAETARTVEVAWGDCACSLYTRKEGRLRSGAMVEALLQRGARVQLLLVSDGDEIEWGAREPEVMAFDAFREHGLQALPEARVVELRGEGF